MPKGAGEWKENEPISASKLNANDALNIREIRVGPGLGIQRNTGTGNATITLDEQNRPWPIVRVKVTEPPSDETPLIAGVTAWNGTDFVGPQFYAKVFTLAAGTFITTEPIDIIVTRPHGGVPVSPQDGYDPTGALWASPLLDPEGNPVLWVQIGEISNLFWAQFDGGTFTEVVSQTISGTFAGLDWVQLEGGRYGTVKNITGTPNFTGVVYGVAPINGICLVFQTYDIGVAPPVPIYYAVVGNHVVVEITGNGAKAHTYTGTIMEVSPVWGNYETTTSDPAIASSGRSCLIINLEEFGLFASWKLGAGNYLLGSVFSSGGIGAPLSGTPIVVVNNGLISNGATHNMVPGMDYWNNPGAVNAAGGWIDIVFSLSLISGKNYYTATLGVDGGGIFRALNFTGAVTPLPIPSGAVTGGTIVGGVLMLTTEP